jgi:DNA ligase-1
VKNMKWIEFCRLNQAIEHSSPTRKINQLSNVLWESLDSDIESYTSMLIDILALDLPANNIANKNAIRWITKAYDCFEDEIEAAIHIHGDIGEGVYHFDESGEDSKLGLTAVYQLLVMDCGKGDGDSFRRFLAAFLTMSALEKKWFLRYWLRTPRNGINAGIVKKILAKMFSKKGSDIKKYAQLHSLSDIVIYLRDEKIPPNTLSVGRFISPMLAKVVPKENWPKEYIIEYKYDGARYQIHKGVDSLGWESEPVVLIFNRKGKIVTHQFPDIVEIVKSWDNLSDEFIIDTEIYPINSDGSPAPFKKMGTRIHSKNISKAIEKCPVEVAVFDSMMYDGQNLMDLSLRNRLEIINKFPKQAGRSIDMDKNDVFYNVAINHGYEGIMVKDLNVKYLSGSRKGWIKYKPPRYELDVVVTGVRYGNGKRSNVFGSYDIAVKDGDEFIAVGSIGTGFSDIDLLLLTQRAKKIIQNINETVPKREDGTQFKRKGKIRTYTLLPRMVLEVTCDAITTDVHGNFGLRFPRMLRIRDDKPVSDINTLKDLKEFL